MTHATARVRTLVLIFIDLKSIQWKVDVAAGTAGVPACYVVLRFDRALVQVGQAGTPAVPAAGFLFSSINRTRVMCEAFARLDRQWWPVRDLFLPVVQVAL